MKLFRGEHRYPGRLWSLLMILLLAVPGRAAEPAAREWRFTSGPATVALLELYTSEGCSSCPPAEAWLADLRRHPGLWRTVVPVAFHVNYWDHLGWRDALADPAFTVRQRRYANAWNARTVYTPGFVHQGREWKPVADLPSPRTSPAAGRLEVVWRENGTAVVSYLPVLADPARRPRYTVSVALLGGGLVRPIARGENAGRTLRHEFAVLRFAEAELAAGGEGAFGARLALPARPELPATRYAVAAWISPVGEPQPLQAVGGWLEREP